MPVRGKDGTIRKILEFSNIQTAHVQSFKAPTEEERGHDFLWRDAPGRSAARSHHACSIAHTTRTCWRRACSTWCRDAPGEARYEHINAFERLLEDNNTILLKFYLHISREEQYERLLAREKDPLSAWKLNPNDWRDLPLWDELTEAYQDALERCSEPEHPWYPVPADRKWFRNLAVMERVVLALRPHRERWLDALAQPASECSEIRALRTAAERQGLVRKPRKGD
mgnify:CR=1 FL=1